MVTSNSCIVHPDGKNGCTGGVYDTSLSNNETIGVIPIMKTLTLGDSWSIVGKNASDTLYTSNRIGFSLSSLPLFLITDVSSVDGSSFPFQGILGLSPNINGDAYTTLGIPIPLYMKNEGDIANAFVGISMNKSGDSSFTIGAFDETKFVN